MPVHLHGHYFFTVQEYSLKLKMILHCINPDIFLKMPGLCHNTRSIVPYITAIDPASIPPLNG